MPVLGSPRSPFSFSTGSPFAKPRTAFNNPAPTTAWASPSLGTEDAKSSKAAAGPAAPPTAAAAPPPPKPVTVVSAAATATPPPQQPSPAAEQTGGVAAPQPSPPRTESAAPSGPSLFDPSDGMIPGARVRTEFGDVGIVRFRGLASFREGEWVGIELSRPKGKNDGTVQGTSYFECKPNHGLFARPTKLVLLPPEEPSQSAQPAEQQQQQQQRAGDVSLPRLEAPSTTPQSSPPASPKHSPGRSPGQRRPSGESPGSGERRGSWPAPQTRPTLKGMPSNSKASLEYALGYSPWPERGVPAGWREAWGAAPQLASGAQNGSSTSTARSGATGASGEGDAALDAVPIPVVVYVSSLAGDRRVTKHCRWAVDFLTSKKVPHAIVDLSVQPHMRTRLVQQLALASPGRGSRLSTQRAEQAIAHLPVVDLGGAHTISAGEMQDMEDHGELDGLLAPIILQYAQSLDKQPPPTALPAARGAAETPTLT